MFIDIHGHVRRLPIVPNNGEPTFSTPEQLIERYDSLGIERAVMLPCAAIDCAYQPQSNEEILDIANNYDGRFIPFCNIDPRAMTNSPDAPLGDLLKHYKDLGCKGVGEVVANLPIGDPRVRNLFKHVEQANLPLTFHLSPTLGGNYGLYDTPGLPGLEESLREFPNLKFFGHSQVFWAEMGTLREENDRAGYPEYPIDSEGAVPKLMRTYPNLHGDLSAGSGHNALARDLDSAVGFLNEFQDRLMFGTDICAPSTPTPLVDTLLALRQNGKISEVVFQKIARENAIRLLGR